MLTVDPDVAELWADALDSGEYQQTGGTLAERIDDPTSPRDGEIGYCCLGVLCDLAKKNGIPVSVTSDYGTLHFNGNTAYLPDEVYDWLFTDPDKDEAQNAEAENPILRHPDGLTDTASGMNDALHFGFPDIAAAIRHTYGLEKN